MNQRLRSTIVAILLAGTAAAASTTEPTHWSRATDHVGEELLVEGAVVAVRREGHVLRLSFDTDPRSFTVALIAGLLSPLPADAEAAYVGQTIRAEGKVRRFRGVPEMVIRDPTRITIVGAVSSAAADAELRDRVEGLERRMERIEEKLKELAK